MSGPSTHSGRAVEKIDKGKEVEHTLDDDNNNPTGLFITNPQSNPSTANNTSSNTQTQLEMMHNHITRLEQQKEDEDNEGQKQSMNKDWMKKMKNLDQAATLPSSRPRKPKLSQPEHYYGQYAKLSTFITQVTMVITLQPSRFPTETSKVLYAKSFLRNTPFLWFQPFATIDPQPKFMLDFKKFCAELVKEELWGSR
ncbi:hypothetical protein LQV05_000352 [Cryptococcus neoformans]|nr:hypothetical protein LQV05_000352 [Cryptococcus neoformans]